MSFLDEYFATAFNGPACEDLTWHATRRTEWMARLRGEHSNGARLAYEVTTDPGSLDAGLWNLEPQYAQSYDR